MSTQQVAPPVDPQYDDEEWLSEDFEPVSFRKMMWQKLKGAPLVGVGIAATGASLVMASYHMKLGNSSRFNFWLRMRVIAQFGTIGAAIWYGGAAFTRAKQDQLAIKHQILLGDLPKNTPIPAASNNPFAKPLPRVELPTPEPEQLPETPAEPDSNYPLPVKERMRVSDFAARLRRAEEQQRLEDEARARGDYGPEGSLQASTNAGQLLRRRMEAEKAKADKREAAKEQ